MTITTQQISQMLTDAKIRPSAQRIAVTGYLLKHRTHPTAEDIYQALQPDYPTLSRTTVYNTLKCLANAGKILVLDIDPITQHFDGCTDEHAHFMCNKCRTIYDIILAKSPIPPEGFQVEQTQVAFRGTCNNCLSK